MELKALRCLRSNVNEIATLKKLRAIKCAAVRIQQFVLMQRSFTVTSLRMTAAAALELHIALPWTQTILFKLLLGRYKCT